MTGVHVCNTFTCSLLFACRASVEQAACREVVIYRKLSDSHAVVIQMHHFTFISEPSVEKDSRSYPFAVRR